ncbi:recombination protein NinB, partial [Salmonella enterica subsp. diarizonae]|nr:recombination protein NinB [Salmonella enterica subsp. diarizonae]
MSIKFYLRDDRIRRNLIDYINSQPVNADFPLVVSFSDPKRTLPQNSLFHAICGELVPIRESTAAMGIKRMNSLIEYSQAFAVSQGIQLR